MTLNPELQTHGTRLSPPAAAGPPSWRRWLSGTGPLNWAAFAVAALLLVPVASVLLNIFLPSHGTWAHLVETVLPRYVLNTIWLAVFVGVGVTVTGVATAWLVAMCDFPGRRAFEWALILPLAIPAYILAYTYTDFLQVSGPVQSLLRQATGWGPRDYWFPDVRSLGGAIAMFVLVLYPYVYLLARAAFLEQSACVLEVSRTLGCTPWRGFLRVALPLARPATIAGAALALMETLADYGTVYHFGVQTFTTGIYRAWFSMGDRVAAAQLSAVLLGFVAVLLMLERFSRSQARYHNVSRSHVTMRRFRLSGVRSAAAVLVCGLPILLGFLLPSLVLLGMALGSGDAQFGPRYVRLAMNSFTLAGITSVLAIGIALLLAYSARLQPTPLAHAANRLAGMGYAVPGSVIAVGVLIPFAAFDNALDAWARASLGIGTGLLLTGTIAALVFAYLVRFLAVSLQTVEASLGKIRRSMDDAVRCLGRPPSEALLRVHAPIMWRSLLTAGLIVFVDVMKELPATLIMRPFNFDTLAVQAHNLASDERLAEASTPALMIVAVALVPIVILSRTIIAAGRSQGRAG